MGVDMEELTNILNSHGLYPQNLEIGVLQRFPAAGKPRTNKSAYLCIFSDGNGAIYGDFTTGLYATWQRNIGREYTRAEKKKFALEQAACREKLDKETKEKNQKAAIEAQKIWSEAQVTTSHPYLIKKRIQPHNTRISIHGMLLIPIYAPETLELSSLQKISPTSQKQFHTGGRIKGCFSAIGNMKSPSEKILICEGFATGASLYEEMNEFTVCALSANNLVSAAITFRKMYPEANIIICGDNDVNGVGQRAANEAAIAVGGLVLIPPSEGTDWNDYLANGGN